MSYADELKRLSKRNGQIIIKIVGLPIKYEKLLIYRYIDEMTVYEIAEKMMLSEDTIDSMMSKARKQFNRIIEKEYHLFDEEQKKFIDLIKGDK